MNKLKAFGIHFSISIVIFLIILYLILSQWYPFPFFTTDGGWKGISIVAFVDIVLGPCLTAIVYKPGKKYLKFDLTVIGILQVAALSWGVFTVHNERPIAAVLIEDYFTTVPHYDLPKQITNDQLIQYSGTIPAYIFLNVPDKDLQAARVRSLQTHVPMSEFAEYYAAIDKTTIPVMLTRAFDVAAYVADKPADKQRYDQFAATHAKELANIAFFEWHGRRQQGYLAVYRDTLKPVDFLAIRPLPVDKKKIR